MQKKSLIIKIIIAGTAAATCGFLIFLLVRSEARPLTWKTDDRLSYEFAIKNVITITMQKKQPATFIRQLKGKIHLRILEKSAEKVRSAVQINPVSLTIDGRTLGILEQLYQLPYLVEFSLEGKPIKYYFPPEVAVDNMPELQGIISLFQTIIPKEGGRSWETEEEDEYGRYIAAYKIKKEGRYTQVIQKVKRIYSEITRKDLAQSQTKMTIPEAITVIQTEYDKSWIHAASLSEKLLIENAEFQGSFSTSAKLVSLLPSSGMEIWDDSWRFDATIARWNMQIRQTKPVEKIMREAALKEHYRKLSINEVLKDYRSINGKQVSHERMAAVRDFLIAHPEKSMDIAKLLRGDRYSDKERNSLILALEQAGHAEAQLALASIIDDTACAEVDRLRAIMALAMIAWPTPETIDTLWSHYDDRPPTSDELSEEDIFRTELSNTSLLALGALYHTTDSGETGETTLHNMISDRLKNEINQIDKEKEREQASLVLTALGNTMDNEFLPTMTEYLQDEDGLLRTASARALKNIETNDDTVQTILTDRLRIEDLDMTRIAIVSTLNKKPFYEPALTVIQEKAVTEPNPHARRQMIEYLSMYRNENNSRKALEQVLEKERDPVIRKDIYRGLFGKERDKGKK